MLSLHGATILLILFWTNAASSVGLLGSRLFSGTGEGSDSEIYQILSNKDYLPNEDDLPKPSIVKNVDNDATYILSKLSDEDLIKLLNQQPKKNEYDLNDLVTIASGPKQDDSYNVLDKLQMPIAGNNEPQKAYFKLNTQEVEPYNVNNDADPKFNALQKLNNILYSRPRPRNSEEDDEKNEMLFDVLVAQLKALCCKKKKSKPNKNLEKLKPLLKKILSQKSQKKSINSEKAKTIQNAGKMNEFLFLVVNDEIKSNVSEDLIAVDPESLAKNSSVLLLGPITTPLTDAQLKLVMNRISNELSQAEYLPLLQKISEGTLNDTNLGLMKSLITGTDSRRYIKAHRCNHQSRLAKVHGGPKWLICTGYLNLNTPSLYD